jgi:O-antigen ligase
MLCAGIVSVAFFAAVAWGGNTPWAMACASGCTFALLGGALILHTWRGRLRIRKDWMYTLILPVLVLIGVQCLNPQPDPDVKTIWPHTVELYTTRLYLLLAVACAALVFVVAQWMDTRRQIRFLILSIIALGAFEAIYGLIQYMGDYRSIWGRPVVDRVARGTFMNRNHYALLLNLSICTSAGYCYYRWRSLLQENGSRFRYALHAPGFGNVLWLSVITIVQGFGLVLSLSRMGIAAMMASIALMAAAQIATDTRGRWPLVFGLAVLGVILALGAYTAADAVLNRFELIAEDTFLEQDRPAIWRDAWAMMQKDLLFGTGLGTFQWTFPAFEKVRADLPAKYAHNDYLQTAAELGFVGLAFIAGAFLAAWRKAIRSYAGSRDPLVRGAALGIMGALAATGLQEITDFSLYIPGVALPFAILMGLNLRISLPGELHEGNS